MIQELNERVVDNEDNEQLKDEANKMVELILKGSDDSIIEELKNSEKD